MSEALTLTQETLTWMLIAATLTGYWATRAWDLLKASAGTNKKEVEQAE